jgi:hypothetical protein
MFRRGLSPLVHVEAPVRQVTPAPVAAAAEPEASDAPKKRGWWQKKTDA